MIIIPKEKPVVENLNSYYLNIKKLLEHYQGELGSGGVHFNSPSAEGAIFFDKDDLLNGFFRNKDGEFEGQAVIDRLMEAADDNNFVISIYEIDAERVYFWANVPAAEKIYKDLSTAFTDLEGLIKKMSSEKLTGYIDVSIGDGKEGGLIFFHNGVIIGGSYSWGKGKLNRSKESQTLLIRKTKESGGIFQVSKIPLIKREAARGRPKAAEPEAPLDVLTMLEELLNIFERIVKSNRAVKSDFNTLLKKKFVEKADAYVFLDPFAAEFNYADQKIIFSGDADDEELVRGLTECVKEIATDIGIIDYFNNSLAPWVKKYQKGLEKYQIGF